MDEIPEDIRKTAAELSDSWARTPHSNRPASAFAAAITAERVSATAAERERCAAIAEGLNGWGSDCGANGVAAHIAAAIRGDSQ